LQYDASISFLLGFGMAMHTPVNNFKRYVIKLKGFLGYLARGIACALNIPMYEKYPFNSLDENNLTHGVYFLPQVGITFFVGFGRVMQYPSKFQKICYETQCVFETPRERYYRCIK